MTTGCGPGRVHCVAVTHESGHVIEAFLDGIERLRRGSRRPVDLVVVDNASTDATRDVLARRGVDAVLCEQNAGWGAGNNRGLERAPTDADFHLFLNPDVRVTPDALEHMIAALLPDGDAGAVVPRFLRAGVPRIGALPDYTLQDAYLGVFGLRRWKSARLARRLDGRGVLSLAGAYPEGACLLVPRAVQERVGRFDERFFLFFDDTDFARRLRAAGFAAVLAGDAVVEETAEKGSRAAPGAGPAEERVVRYLHYLAAELRYHDKWWGQAVARRVARYRLRVDLPIQEGRWRRRHGIRGVGERGRAVVEEFLDRLEGGT